MGGVLQQCSRHRGPVYRRNFSKEERILEHAKNLDALTTRINNCESVYYYPENCTHKQHRTTGISISSIFRNNALLQVPIESCLLPMNTFVSLN